MDRYKFLKNREGVKGKTARKECHNNARKDKRMQLLGELRAMQDVPSENPPTVVNKKKSRLELLKEWKLEKAQKENQCKQNKKPPFYAGKLQTKATGSPMLAPTAAPSVRPGAVTRSRAKANNIVVVKPVETVKKKKPVPQTLKLQQLNKVEENKLQPVENYQFVLPKAVTDLHKLTIPQSPKITKSARKSTKRVFESIKKESEAKSMIFNQLEDHELKAPKAKRRLTVKELLTATENIMEPTKTLEENSTPSEMTENIETMVKQDNIEKMDYSPDLSPRPFNNFQHLNYSPFVEKERGSTKSRRSSKKSMTLSERIDAEIAEEETIFKAKIATFRLFLSNETSRLLGLAETWVNYFQNEPKLPSDVEGDINAVAGKTKLLTSDKFKQFEGLIDKCEGGDPKIKVDDLEGFHDWVSLEIEDLDKVFSKLEERKAKNWVAEAPPVQKVVKKKPVNNVVQKRNAPSNMRAFIMAARNKVQNPEEKRLATPVRQPISPASPWGTPRDRTNLRVQVLQRSSGLAVLAATAAARASLSPSKSPDFVTLQPTYPSVTPSKSILKTTPSSLSGKKSVVFRCLESEGSSLDEALPSVSSEILTSTPATEIPASTEESTDNSAAGLALVDSPVTNTFIRLRKSALDRKYFLQPEDSSLESSIDLQNSALHLRRSTRISRKSQT